jgi:formyltetrahydrofolate-dependent phosphoribosylglycinamide formyltransferase
LSTELRLTVLFSGLGSNLRALHGAIAEGRLRARLVSLYCNRPDSPGLAWARSQGLSARLWPIPSPQEREGYDGSLAMQIAEDEPDLVLLLGWDRLLGRAFLQRLGRPAWNLHPALPGAFPGQGAIRRAWLAARRQGLAETGVMVHALVEQMDAGPVIGLTRLPLHPEEALEALEERVHAAERSLVLGLLRAWRPT